MPQRLFENPEGIFPFPQQIYRLEIAMTISTVLEPLIRRKLFVDEQSAIQELARDYVLRHVEVLAEQIRDFENRYGMGFDRFAEYLHQRSLLLASDHLDTEQRRALGQAVMAEEDDWLEWKAAQEMLDSWLGLGDEVAE